MSKASSKRTNWKRQALAAERLRFESVRSLQTRQDPVRLDLLALGVAHEFNNILGAALGHAEWALDSQNEEDMKESLQVIRIACYRCAQITKSLQGIVQPREEQKTILYLKDLFLEIRKLWSAHSEKAKVEINYPENENKAYIDPSAFVEIFSNLIKNSIEAFEKKNASDNKKISIDCEIRESFIYIHYKDSGPGIPLSHRPYLFQPFFTTKGTMGAVYKSQSSGEQQDYVPKNSGLGLFLSKALAQEMGGDLKLIESDEDQGVHFEISFPIVK